MANTNANVVRVFGNYATLDTGAGSIQKQFVYADDTDQIGVHQTDDSMKWFSDDSKQVLLAGAQTVTGKKTHQAASSYEDNQKVLLGDSETGQMYFDGSSTYLKETTNAIIIDSNATYLDALTQRVMTVESTGVEVTSTMSITHGNFTVSKTGVNTLLKDDTQELFLSGAQGMRFQYNTTDYMYIDSTGPTISSGIPLTLGNAWQSGAPTPDGYVTILDSAGATLRLSAYKVP